MKFHEAAYSKIGRALPEWQLFNVISNEVDDKRLLLEPSQPAGGLGQVGLV